MPVVINLLLAAIQPRTFFIPCASIILGSGFAAYSGIVDGNLFLSLLLLTILAQVIFNLSNDFQQAFVNNASQQKNPVQGKIKQQMLKLILACFLVWCLGLTALMSVSVNGGATAYLLVMALFLLVLAIVRFKTLFKSDNSKPTSALNLLVYGVISGVLPTLISYYLHTSELNIIITLLAINCGLLASSLVLSQKIVSQLILQSSKQIGVLTAAVATTLKWQKIIVISSTFMTGLIGYYFALPFLTWCFIFALPSIVATIATIEHVTEIDVAQSQFTKLCIAIFAYWVLWVAGLMF